MRIHPPRSWRRRDRPAHRGHKENRVRLALPVLKGFLVLTAGTVLMGVTVLLALLGAVVLLVGLVFVVLLVMMV